MRWCFLFFILFISLLTQGQVISKQKTQTIRIEGSSGRYELVVQPGKNPIQLFGLNPNLSHTIHWSPSTQSASYLIRNGKIQPSNSFKILSGENTDRFSIYSELAQVGFLSVSSSSNQANDKPFASRANSIQSTGGFTAEELIKDVFIGGDCFDVENVTFQGISQMIGTFNNGNSSISMDEGVLICTGNINQITGPNSQTGITNDLGLTAQDPDISEISQAQLFDVASIEFDFRPKSDSISFKYVFASDEYCDYVNSQFNDKFGFFISGPGISGIFTNNADNIAYVPGTTEFVAINSVNIQSNPAYYVDNVPLGQPQQGPFPCTQDLAMQGVAINDIEYDGFTVVLTASTPVVPCELYHIKIVIADQEDGLFDSALFLEKNSFNAGGLSDVSIVYSRPDDAVMYEGCSNGYIEFFKLDPSTFNEDVEVNFTISPNSTATPGIDYEIFSTLIIIPAGQESIRIPINIFSDGLAEGIESIILLLDNSCRCSSEEIEILISDLEPLVLGPDNQNYCETTNTTISAVVSGGLQPLTYQWNTGETNSSINLTLNTSDTFFVTVTDDCGNSLDTFSYIEIINENSGVFESNDLEYCPNEIIDTTVIIRYLGQPPFVMHIARNGIVFDTVTVLEDFYALHIDQAGVYSIASIQSIDCAINPIDDLVVNIVELSATAEITHIECGSDLLGEIEINVIGDYPPYSFLWSDGFQTDDPVASFLEGIYSVTITDNQGCEIYESYEIEKLTGPRVEIDSVRHITCAPPSLGNISITASGGSGIYEYNWLDQNNTTNIIDSLEAGVYFIEVFDVENDCRDTTAIEILDFRSYPDVQLTGDTFTCETSNARLQVNISDTTAHTFSISTLNGQILQTSDTNIFYIDEPDTYIVTSLNESTSCTTIDTFNFVRYLFQPTAVAGPDENLDCVSTPVMLDGTTSILNSSTVAYWMDSDNQPIAPENQLTVEVASIGLYILEVFDTLSKCIHRDSVLVTMNNPLPIAEINPSNVLTCRNSQITVTAQTNSNMEQFIYQWSGINDNYISTNDPEIIIAQDTGLLFLVVQDTLTKCVNNDTLNISSDRQLPTVSVSPTDTLTCTDFELTINGIGSSAGNRFNYLWETDDGIITGAINEIATSITSPGTYLFTVTDTINGCQRSDSVLILPDDRLPRVMILTPDSLTCSQTSIWLDGSSSSHGGNFTFDWQSINGNILSPLDSNIILVNQAGSYVLKVTDLSNGCTNQQSVVVKENKIQPNIDIAEANDLNCINTSSTIDATGSDQSENFDYIWTTPSGHFISGQQGLNPIIDSAGVYYLRIVNTITGCEQLDSITINEDYSVPDIQGPSDYILNCIIDSVIISTSLFPESPVTFNWTLTNGTSLSNGPPKITTFEPGQITLEIISLETGCAQERIFSIFNDTVAPNIDAGPNHVVDCGAFELELETRVMLNRPYHVEWSTADGMILSNPENELITINSIGTYQVLVQDISNGCIALDDVVVSNNGLISTILDIQQPNCLDSVGIVSINSASSGTPPYFYTINHSPTFLDAWPITLAPDTYSISIEDSEGCSDQQEFIILPPRTIELSFGEIDTLKFGESVFLIPQVNIPENEIIYFEWTPPDYLDDVSNFNPLATPFDHITYQLVVRDSSNCEAISFISLFLDKDIAYFIPSAFSPNNDGVNDRISILTNENIEEVLSFQIFNRWGDRVFENFNFPPNQLEFGWDGRLNGKVLNPGVFVYQAELRTVFQKRLFLKGEILLVK